MRTPTFEGLSATIAKLENQVSKLEAKKIALAEAREKLANLSSTESVEGMRKRLAAKKAEAERLAALLESLESEEADDDGEDFVPEVDDGQEIVQDVDNED